MSGDLSGNLSPIAAAESNQGQDLSKDLQDCWNQIGVLGDRSCPILGQVIHCRNCSVYGAAGRSLLERVAPPNYLEEWTQVLAEVAPPEADRRAETIVPSSQTQSLMLFQLGSECLALPVNLLQLITPPSGIHRLPHRPSGVLLGLGNIRGEIVICVSLAALLGIPSPPPDPSLSQAQPHHPRWVVMGDATHPWVSPVDEIYGIHRFAIQHFQAPPIVVSQTAAYTQGITYWNDRKVNVLDGDRVLKGFYQALMPNASFEL
jgi:chemotaxis-related protein WspD